MMKFLSITAMSLLLAAPVLAQSVPDKDKDKDPNPSAVNRAAEVEQRIDRQQDRVTDDLQKDRISAAQAAEDQAKLNKIQGHLADDTAMSGGGITSAQQQNLNRQLNATNSLLTSQRRH